MPILGGEETEIQTAANQRINIRSFPIPRTPESNISVQGFGDRGYDDRVLLKGSECVKGTTFLK